MTLSINVGRTRMPVLIFKTEPVVTAPDSVDLPGGFMLQVGPIQTFLTDEEAAKFQGYIGSKLSEGRLGQTGQSDV